MTEVEFWQVVYLAALNRNLNQKTAEEQAWRAVDHLRNFMKREG